MKFPKMTNKIWISSKGDIEENIEFQCGFCDRLVSKNPAYILVAKDNISKQFGHLFFCPNCYLPSTFIFNESHSDLDLWYPGPKFGAPLKHLPEDLNQIYEEARNCTTYQAYTAAVMLCRKILMNVAVLEGAQERLTFKEYVNYLETNNYLPVKGKDWTDQIRAKGNDANHKIEDIKKEDAEIIIYFTENLLRNIYELPGSLQKLQSGVT
jgi:hypothetical protein